MLKKEFGTLVSPVTHEKLTVCGNKLCEPSGKKYKTIKNVPVLLPEKARAKWHRELIEIILWEYPDEIEKLYSEVDFKSSPVPVYTKYIKRLLHDKQGIINAFESYSQNNTKKWIVQSDNSTVTLNQKIKFNRYAKKSNGKSRAITKINANGIFEVYPYFGQAVNANSPETIVELGTGAGGGTAAVALEMNDNSRLFTVDIGFECLGNAIGIRKYQKKNIVPICANFWYLPFSDESVDAVCTYNGFDESRETEKTVAEIARILKSGGTLTVASRKNAFMRQSAVLEPFGFTAEEATALLKKCRVYSSIDSLCGLCEKHGLALVTQKEFQINDSLTTVLTQFIKCDII